MKLIKGNTYSLKFKKTIVTRCWRGSNRPSEWDKVEISGDFEYIGSRGCRHHFYEVWKGIDLLLTKDEFLEYSNNAKKND